MNWNLCSGIVNTQQGVECGGLAIPFEQFVEPLALKVFYGHQAMPAVDYNNCDKENLMNVLKYIWISGKVSNFFEFWKKHLYKGEDLVLWQ